MASFASPQPLLSHPASPQQPRGARYPPEQPVDSSFTLFLQKRPTDVPVHSKKKVSSVFYGDIRDKITRDFMNEILASPRSRKAKQYNYI